MKSTRGATVAVMGLGAGGSGVAVLRALAESHVAGERRIGLAANALDEGVYATDLLDDAFVVGPSSDNSLVLRLRELAVRENVSVLLPTSAADVSAIVASERKLREVGLSTFAPTPSQLALLDPVLVDRVATDNGIDTPKTVVLSSGRQLSRLHDVLTYPIVLRAAGLSVDARTLDEVCIAFQKVCACGLPAVAQERATGRTVQVVGLGDGEGGLAGAVVGKALRWDGPHAWSMMTVASAPAITTTTRWVSATRWRGPFELTLELTQRRALLRDVQAHFPAWIALATAAGINLPRAAVRLALGMHAECPTNYIVGTALVRGTADRVVSMRELAEASALGEVRRTSSITERAVIAPDFSRVRRSSSAPSQ